MLSEKDARQKWCPLLGEGREPQKCCASMCMAWRWCEDPFRWAFPKDDEPLDCRCLSRGDTLKSHGLKTVGDVMRLYEEGKLLELHGIGKLTEADLIDRIESAKADLEHRQGYCGLAGKG